MVAADVSHSSKPLAGGEANRMALLELDVGKGGGFGQDLSDQAVKES